MIMNKHAKFWLTIGSFLSVATVIAFMVILAAYCRNNGGDEGWSALLLFPLVYTIAQTFVNYFSLTEDK